MPCNYNQSLHTNSVLLLDCEKQNDRLNTALPNIMRQSGFTSVIVLCNEPCKSGDLWHILYLPNSHLSDEEEKKKKQFPMQEMQLVISDVYGILLAPSPVLNTLKNKCATLK